jgi:hypothetical protein
MKAKSTTTAKWPFAVFVPTDMTFVTIAPVRAVVELFPFIASDFSVDRVPYNLP